MKKLFLILIISASLFGQYKVTWTAVNQYSIPCEQPKHNLSEYGIKGTRLTTTLGYCFETKSEFKEKIFVTVEEVDEFLKNMPMRNGYGSGCEDVEVWEFHKEPKQTEDEYISGNYWEKIK